MQHRVNKFAKKHHASQHQQDSKSEQQRYKSPHVRVSCSVQLIR